MNIRKKILFVPFLQLWLIGILSLTFFLNGCNGDTQLSYQGKTMGTTWHVKIVAQKDNHSDTIKRDIQSALDAINNKMSLFNPDSELSRINNTKANTPIPVSDDLMAVLIEAKNLYTMTNGKWDCTIAPLTNFWGFGTNEQKKSLPEPKEIAPLIKLTGFDHIKIDHHKKILTKNQTATAIDLGAIAKGYAVDVLARILFDKGIDNFIVEIGGEIYAAGHRIDGSNWKVGINRPEKNAPQNALTNIIRLTDRAVATSGDYRNFYTIEGRTFSHIIDPTTGWPVENAIASVTVISKSTTFADGLATAIMVLGIQDGLALVNSLNDTEVLIIARKDKSYHNYTSNGWNY